MTSNKQYVSLCAFLVVALASGNIFAADVNAKIGNIGSSNILKSGKSSNAASIDSDQSTDYPTGWYYYGNPSSAYEPYYDAAYIEDDMQTSAFSPIYVEQEAQHKTLAPPSPGMNYWNYCPDKKGYYPYVSDCPTQWQKISAQPIGQESGYWYYCKDPAGYYPYVNICNNNWQKIVLY